MPCQWLTAPLLLSTHGTGFDLDSGGSRRSQVFRCEILGFRHGSIQVCSTSEFAGGFVCLQSKISTLSLHVDNIPPINAVTL